MPPHLTYNEKELLLRVAAGEDKAFNELVKRYNGTVYAFVRTHIRRKELVDEVVWDVFMQVWVSRETLPELQSLSNFLFVIAKNKGFNALRTELREENRRNNWQVAEDELSENKSQEIEAVALSLIDKAVLQLPLQQQKVWVLSRRKKRTYVQIAGEMNISRETVKSYLQAANENIKQFIITKLKDFPGFIVAFFIFLNNKHPL